MPMMVNAAGEGQQYTLPMPGLETGQYTVQWKAVANQREHQGRFTFTVRSP